MSLALYRKYRPATFAELKGQEHVAEPLQQALRNGRINHAYLFSGPRGCGKTSSARILARSLNCEQGPTPEPCGKCDSCLALGPSGAGHIDVIEIDAASHGGVDDARDLRERAFFAPVAARYKIYIIDEAHMVTREGFNALLKLVEEPPAHLKFIFATTEPEKVIGTIRSRTHHYPFRLIPPGTLRELLEEILQKEDVPYEPAAIPLVVRAGAGSARDSESILDQLLAGAGEEGITYARAVSLLGYTDATLLDEVVDAVAARDGGAVFAAIDRVMEGGQDPRRFAADLLERFRDLVILSNVPDAGTTGLLDAPPDELERMSAQASRLGLAELTRAADLLHTGLTEMRGATAPRLLLELICARILLPGAYDDEASLLTRLDRLERRFAIAGTPTTDDRQTGPNQPSQPHRPAPAQGSPPAQGGEPNSIVQRRVGAAEGERRSGDNSAVPSAGNAVGGAVSGGTGGSGERGGGSGHAGSGTRSGAPGPGGASSASSPGGSGGAGLGDAGPAGVGFSAPPDEAGQGGSGATGAGSGGASGGGPGGGTSDSGSGRARTNAGRRGGTDDGGARGGVSGAAGDGGSAHGGGDVEWPTTAQPAGGGGYGSGTAAGHGGQASGYGGQASGHGQGSGGQGRSGQGGYGGQASGYDQGSGGQGRGDQGGHGGQASGYGGQASGHGQGSGGQGRSDQGGYSGQASGSGQGGYEQGEQRSNPSQAAPGSVDVGAIRGMWVDILEAVKQRSKVAWIVLMEGVDVASLEGNVLTLAFVNDGKRRGFTTGGKDAVLREALNEILGVDWRIEAILDNGQGGRPSPPPPPPPPEPGNWGASVAPQRPAEPERPAPPPEPPPPEPIDEADEVDPEGDADAGNDAALTGMALIEQVLGGTVIQEIDNA
jgi:DNA polymerase III subunit gamma/tau